MKKVLIWPDENLSSPTVDWNFDLGKEELLSLAREMGTALKEHKSGVALAANQIGLQYRIFVIEKRYSYLQKLPSLIINPQIEKISEEKDVKREGCLSFPNIWVPIERPVKIWVNFQDKDAQRLHISLTGFDARMFMHEIEHLDGKTFLDNLSREQREDICDKMASLRK